MRDSRNEAASVGIFVESPASDIFRSAMMLFHSSSDASIDFMEKSLHFHPTATDLIIGSWRHCEADVGLYSVGN
jgi:hypothetical protein